MYVDDLKTFAKYEKELQPPPIQTIRIFSLEIGTELEIVNCAMVKIK